MTSDTPDLSRPCAECQHANASNARFCNQCGSRLIESLSPIAPDFKRLTVLFGDLVGSVELSSQLDPEDWHTLLGAYQQAAGDAIRRRPEAKRRAGLTNSSMRPVRPKRW